MRCTSSRKSWGYIINLEQKTICGYVWIEALQKESVGSVYKRRKREDEQAGTSKNGELCFHNPNIPREKLEDWMCDDCGEQNQKTTIKCFACGRPKAEWRFGDDEDLVVSKEENKLSAGLPPKGRLWRQACRAVEKRGRKGDPDTSNTLKQDEEPGSDRAESEDDRKEGDIDRHDDSVKMKKTSQAKRRRLKAIEKR